MKIKNRSKICLIISGAIILVAVVLTIFGHGINLGIDFEGGLSMQYDLKTAAAKGDIENVLNGMNIKSYTATVQGAGEIDAEVDAVAEDGQQRGDEDDRAGDDQADL